MAKNEKRRQQKLMKKRQKQKKKKKLAAVSGASNTDKAILRRGRAYPIHECLISGGWREEGMASIYVMRRQNESQLLMGAYIVDLFCLGVKDAFCRPNLSMATYNTEMRPEFIESRDGSPCSPELAHQIIYGAVDYAGALGFRPHKDFQLARYMLDEPETVPFNPDLEFGKDGKPLYISGPHDSPARILKKLEERLGPRGFEFMAGGPMMDEDSW